MSIHRISSQHSDSSTQGSKTASIARGLADVGLMRWPPLLTRRVASFRSALEAR
jgi:hypothetical protein